MKCRVKALVLCAKLWCCGFRPEFQRLPEALQRAGRRAGTLQYRCPCTSYATSPAPLACLCRGCARQHTGFDGMPGMIGGQCRNFGEWCGADFGGAVLQARTALALFPASVFTGRASCTRAPRKHPVCTKSDTLPVYAQPIGPAASLAQAPGSYPHVGLVVLACYKQQVMCRSSNLGRMA